MSYYVFEITTANENFSELWKVEGNTAIRADMPKTLATAGSYIEVPAGESILPFLTVELKNRGSQRDIKIHSLRLDPGQYYPRIARPDQRNLHLPGRNPGELEHKNFIAMALGQLNVLSRQLEGICQIIHPTAKTFDTYGHTIRNLLILACTEVETHWRGVLAENGFNKAVYRTNDYVMHFECNALRRLCR